MKGLKIENLRFHTLGPFSLDIGTGECVGITGPSGTGKSLFLRAVADMDPHTGKVSLDGAAASDMPAPEWRKKAGLLPAESAWWFDTVGEHFPASLRKARDGRLGSLGFDDGVFEWKISRLSSGERQRLGLFRMLANRPEALLLDEPTANLDAENTARVEKLLESYRTENRSPVIWVSHDPDQLGRVSDRWFVLKNGILGMPN